jgi:hypothetical protein
MTGCLCLEGDRALTVAMAPWKDVEQAEPESAARVRRLFDAGRHKTMARLRADGSPRISGIECEFADGELRFGSMPGVRKGADLRRDPRFALRGPAFDLQEGREAEWPGEAKIAGRAVLAGPAGGGPGGDLFLADIAEAVAIRLKPGATFMVIESWTQQRGLRLAERECRGHLRRGLGRWGAGGVIARDDLMEITAADVRAGRVFKIPVGAVASRPS